MRKIIALVLMNLTIIGFAVVPVIAQLETEVANFSPLEVGWGRIYISAGHFKNPLFHQDLKGPRRTGPVYINNVEVGTIGYQEYIGVDLLPGVYEFYWELSIPDKMFSEKLILNIEANETRYFSANMTTRGTGSAFGLVGALASEYLTKGFLVEEQLNFEGRLASIYEYMDNVTPDSLQSVKTPTETTSHSDDSELDKFDKQEIYSKFKKLKELYEKDLITKEEYDKERQELLENL